MSAGSVSLPRAGSAGRYCGTVQSVLPASYFARIKGSQASTSLRCCDQGFPMRGSMPLRLTTALSFSAMPGRTPDSNTPDEGRSASGRWLVGGPARGARGAIWLYKIVISPMLMRSCRFIPSCSSYADEAIERYGTLRGVWLTVRRVARCHPLCRGGFDPVPPGVRTTPPGS